MDNKLKKNILFVVNVIVMVLSIMILAHAIIYTPNDFIRVLLPIVLIIGATLNFFTMRKFE
ncbi:MAG: hypothetical protein ACRC1M_00960 [Methanobacteriaceae archaeon]